jgi:hypothetical protein
MDYNRLKKLAGMPLTEGLTLKEGQGTNVVFSFANGEEISTVDLDKTKFINALKNLVVGEIRSAATHPDLMDHENEQAVADFIDNMHSSGHISITFK